MSAAQETSINLGQLAMSLNTLKAGLSKKRPEISAVLKSLQKYAMSRAESKAYAQPLLFHLQNNVNSFLEMGASKVAKEKWIMIGRIAEVMDDIGSRTQYLPSSIIQDSSAVKFWTTHFQNNDWIPLQQFVAALRLRFPAILSISFVAWNELNQILDYLSMGCVSSIVFQKYTLQWFAPFSHFLNEIQNVSSLGCFHPFMSGREAETHVRGCQKGAGAFVIRLSRRTPGTFAYCYIRKDGRVLHDLVQVIQHQGQKSFFWKRAPSAILPSITTLTQAHRTEFQFPCCGSQAVDDIEDSDEELYDVNCPEAGEDYAALDAGFSMAMGESEVNLLRGQSRVSVNPSHAKVGAVPLSSKGVQGQSQSAIRDSVYKRSETLAASVPAAASGEAKKANVISSTSSNEEKPSTLSVSSAGSTANVDSYVSTMSNSLTSRLAAPKPVPYALGERLLHKASCNGIQRGQMSKKEVVQLRSFVSQLDMDKLAPLHKSIISAAHADMVHFVSTPLLTPGKRRVVANEEVRMELNLYNCTKQPLVVDLEPVISKQYFIGFFPNKLRLPAPRILKKKKAVVTVRFVAFSEGLIEDAIQIHVRDRLSMFIKLRVKALENSEVQFWDIPPHDIVHGIEARIGKGAGGTVSKCLLWQTRVAIKTFNEKSREKDFRRELTANELVRDMRHPNLVHVIGAGWDHPGYSKYIAYELAKSSLDMELYSRNYEKIDLKTRVRWAYGIAAGIAALHSVKLIHRDMKSLNILISHGGRAMITDFGSTREANSFMTMQVGTFLWMAPEVVNKKPYDHSSDVFSYGLVLYELFNGSLPRRSMKQQLAGEVPEFDISLMHEAVPKDILYTYNRCCAVKSSSRPEAADVAERLYGVLDCLENGDVTWPRIAKPLLPNDAMRKNERELDEEAKTNQFMRDSMEEGSKRKGSKDKDKLSLIEEGRKARATSDFVLSDKPGKGPGRH